MKNYVCQPKKERKTCIFLCLVLLFLSATAFFLSTYMAAFRALGQTVSVIFLLLFVQLSAKFLLTEYVYTFEGDKFYLSTRQGKKKKDLGHVPLSAEVKLFTKKEWEEKKENFSVKHRFSYCQNLFSKNESYLIFSQEETLSLLVFEPDEKLLSLLKERIENTVSAFKD